MFEQRGGTSVLLTWTPPDPLGDTTGYIISYTGGGSSGCEPVNGGSTNSYTLTGLLIREMYDISIIGTSEHFYSESVDWETVTLVPGELHHYKTKVQHVHVIIIYTSRPPISH